MAVNFRYVPTSGDLSGTSFEKQTQQAINEIGAGSEKANSKAEDAIDLANNALTLAQSAVDTSQAANQAAQDAVATANQANANIQGAYTAAEAAQYRADLAYFTATTAAEAAQNASSDATSATTTASDAAALAQSASDMANTNAESIANLTGTIGSLSGIYVTTVEEADLNTLFIPNMKMYFTGTLENSPVTAPAFFYAELNTGSIVCIQTIWNQDAPEKIYRRSGTIEYTSDGPVPTWQDWTSSRGESRGVDVGTIALLPFRPSELPSGWYFCNADRYPLTSLQGTVLNGLSDNFKADWGITANAETISLPDMFHTDGRGYFIRPVDGARQVGSIELDEFKQHNHVQYGANDYHNASNGSLSVQARGTVVSRDTGGNETRPINVGMTPAIFLGV